MSTPSNPATEGFRRGPDPLVSLLRSAVALEAIPDRRREVALRIGRYRQRAARRRLAAGCSLIVAMVAGSIGLAGRSATDQTVLGGAPIETFDPVERTIAPGLVLRVESDGAGLAVTLGDIEARASRSFDPVAPYQDFGVVPVGGSAVVTGATQSRTRADLAPVVVVAVSADPAVAEARLVVVGRDREDTTRLRSGVAVLAVSLDETDPQLQVRVEVFDAAGDVLGSQSFFPFSQDPWVCDTNTEMAGLDGPGRSEPSPVPEALEERLFSAPLPAACP